MNSEKTLKRLERDVSSAQATRDRLARETMVSEQQLANARERRRSLLLEDQPNAKALRNVDVEIASVARLLDGLSDAAVTAAAQLVQVEKNLATERDRQRRQVEAANVKATITKVEQAYAEFTVAAQPLIHALRGVGRFESDALANGLAAILLGLSDEIVAGIPVLLNGLNDYAAAVVAGDAEISRSRTEVKPAQQPKAKAKMETVFLIESVRWQDAAGATHAVRQYSTCSMPAALAAKCLRCGAGLPIGDPRIDRFRKAFATSGFEVAAAVSDCIDLNQLDPDIDLQKIAASVIVERQKKQRQAAAA